jgi:hypothetical protein
MEGLPDQSSCDRNQERATADGSDVQDAKWCSEGSLGEWNSSQLFN